ncbi:predicted protein [Histoplasma capsulatum H143]|uniref:Uncharacterized protein n=1 Tax=Ajellomyces capsulatus (strain H143) TaxID=544712 RepID=C6HC74_AJECH|nr:predicted protein [Histoplasma capsulatum H143]
MAVPLIDNWDTGGDETGIKSKGTTHTRTIHCTECTILQSMRRLRAGAGVNPGDLEPWAEGVLLLCCFQQSAAQFLSLSNMANGDAPCDAGSSDGRTDTSTNNAAMHEIMGQYEGGSLWEKPSTFQGG